MQPSHIFSIICDIRKQTAFGTLFPIVPHVLRNYKIGRNENMRDDFITAEVWPDSLDKGADPEPLAQRCAKCVGSISDRSAQYIGKRLGGDGMPNNVFPLNSKLDTSNWEADEAKVYDHVNGGGDRRARLMYGIEYEAGKTYWYWRPCKIYYHFELFEGETIVGLPIANVFENTREDVRNPRSIVMR